jgi:molecular chaperone GrpE
MMVSDPSRPEDDEDVVPVDPEEEDTALWPIQRVPALGGEEQPSTEPGHPLEFPEPGEDRPADSTSEVPRVAADLEPSRPESPARIIAAISQIGRLVEEKLATLQASFEREVRAEATRERTVDRLHAELQEYKHDLLLKVQRPIFLDLIQLHDDIGKMIEAQQCEEAEKPAYVRSALESIRTAIVDILYRQGVEPFQNEGDDFDPRRQRAVTTVPTDDPALNKTIAARLRTGFLTGDKIIRSEIVSVHTLKK